MRFPWSIVKIVRAGISKRLKHCNFLGETL